MIIITIATFVAVYAYKLFSWSDLFPLTLNDITYMLGFTVEHIIFASIHMVQRATYAAGLTNWFAIKLFEDGDTLVWVLDNLVIHTCIISMCAG